MKRTQWIELLNNIKRKFVAFIAILIFSAFGIAFFFGLSWSESALVNSVYKIWNEQNGHDFEILFPYGFDEEEIQKINQISGVSQIECGYCAYQYFISDGLKNQAKILSVPRNIDVLFDIEGVLPSESDEIAIDEYWAKENNISIGDKITFLPDNTEKAHLLSNLLKENYDIVSFDKNGDVKYLSNTTYNVTALVKSSSYISILASGYEASPIDGTPVNCIMFIDNSGFDVDSYTGFTNVYIRCDELRKYVNDRSAYSSALVEIRGKIVSRMNRIASEKVNKIQTAVSFLSAFANTDSVEIDNVVCTAFSRDNNASLSMVCTIAEMLGVMKYNMSIPFFLISILVAYSSVSRIVYKDSSYIGTKKAIGMNDCPIYTVYMLFSISASLGGAIIGVIISRVIIEPLFLKLMNKTFMFPQPVYAFNVSDVIIPILIEVCFIGAASYIAVSKTLKKDVLSLIVGDNIPEYGNSFYENKPWFQRLPLIYKCIFRNVLNDKRRVCATLIGISGCTALVVLAISLFSAVQKSFDSQFNKLQDYKYIVYFDSETETASVEIGDILNKRKINHALVYTTNIKLIAPDEKSTVSGMMVPQTDFGDLISIYSMNGEKTELTDGVWLNCAFSEFYDIDVNDNFSFIDASSVERFVSCGGVYEYYMQCPRIILNTETYRGIFGEEAVMNAFLVSGKDVDAVTLEKLFSDTDGYICTFDYYSRMKGTFATFLAITYAVSSLYLILSFLMAVFILLDLLVMFTEEKKQELVTMMINGYSVKYAKRYIYSDTIGLTVIGILLGIIIGTILGKWNLYSMTSELSYYIQDVDPFAWLAGGLISSVSTFVICIFALRRIDTFSLTNESWS